MLSGLQAVAPGANPKEIEALRSQVRGSLNSLADELGKPEGPDVASVDVTLADARNQVEDLGHAMGYIDANGAMLAEGASADAFHEVSDYLSDIEVAWRNQRPTLLEIQSVLPHRRARLLTGAVASILAMLLILWLLLHNSHPQNIAASDGPLFPTIPLSSVPPPSKVVAPTLDTSLHVSSRPNTTPPLPISLPNETRTRTAGTDFPSINISSYLPTAQNTNAVTGPINVDPQSVQQSCNKDNTFLAPTGYKVTNFSGGPVLFSATVTGNWAVAGPAAGSIPNGQTVVVGVSPTYDQNSRAVACMQLVNSGRSKGDFFLTITVNNQRFPITDTITLFNHN